MASCPECRMDGEHKMSCDSQHIPMKVVTTPPCPICNKQSELLVPEVAAKRIESGELVQHVLPYWSASQRELLISGCHEACWEPLMDLIRGTE